MNSIRNKSILTLISNVFQYLFYYVLLKKYQRDLVFFSVHQWVMTYNDARMPAVFTWRKGAGGIRNKLKGHSLSPWASRRSGWTVCPQCRHLLGYSQKPTHNTVVPPPPLRDRGRPILWGRRKEEEGQRQQSQHPHGSRQ